MKQKMIAALLGICIGTMSFTGLAMAEEVQTEAQTEVQTEAQEVQLTIAEPEEEDIDPFVEGSAVLTDYGYEAGTLDKNGWNSPFLNMLYKPAAGVKMGLEQNEEVNKYHLRHGEDKQVAVNELVALMSDGSYMQMAIEVNPNAEEAEDILERFMENEDLKLPSKVRDTEIAGKAFKFVSGMIGEDKYILSVSTDQENYALAMKVKYATTDSRKALMAGFDQIEKEEETEAVTEAVTEDAEFGVPELFEEAEEITEAATE